MIANQFRYLLLAIDRYTRFPVPGRVLQWARPPGFDARRAIRYMPIAGAVAGLYAAIIYLLFAQLLPHAVATLIAIIFGMLITGGRQEAALARFFDARPRRRRPPQRLDALAADVVPADVVPADVLPADVLPADVLPADILPADARAADTRPAGAPAADARAGGALAAPGVLILLLVVLLRAETLGSLDPSWLSVALATAQPLSYGVAALAAIGEHRRLGSGSRRARLVDRLIAATIAVLPVAIAIEWFDQQQAFTFAIVPALVFGLWLRVWLARRLRAMIARAVDANVQQAVVRDGAGAIQQISELAYHLGLLVWWSLIGADASSDVDTEGDGDEGDGEPSDDVD